MACVRCHREIPGDADFCQHCGAQQSRGDTPPMRYLRRSLVDRQVAGVCGGIARYLDIDPVLVRVTWVILSVIPGAIFLGVLAYLLAWLVIPEAAPGTEPAYAVSDGGWRSKRLQRSSTDSKIAGVCGGIAEYFAVDSTAIRLLWVVLSIFPGAIICGILTYGVAWLIMPASPMVSASTEPVSTPAGDG